jgi:leucyl aminopeptidase
MAKKKSKKKTAKKPAVKKTAVKKDTAEVNKRGPRKGTRIAFLRELYTKDPNIANDKALTKLLAKFPESNADVKSIVTWKKMLRDEGFDIPLQRAGAKPGPRTKKDTPDKKAKKTATIPKGKKKKKKK